MKIVYLMLSIAAAIFALGFALSQYVDYKEYRLSRQKAVQDCIEKSVRLNASGFEKSNASQKCEAIFAE